MKIIDIDINIEIQFGERVGHGGWLIGPKLSQPEAYPACTERWWLSLRWWWTSRMTGREVGEVVFILASEIILKTQ